MESSDPTKTTSPPPASKPHHYPNGDGHGHDHDHDHDHEPNPTTSSPISHKSTSNDPAIQAPPNQEMEAYRIPASVFERNKSSTPADWSAASNESLFSIHMGNMSFAANDNQWKSGELAASDAAARLSTSDLMFGYAGQASAGGTADTRCRELGIAEATMLEVIKENEGRSRGSSLSEVRNTHRSPGSNQSNMSFAFSTVGGDTQRIPSSVKSTVPQVQLSEPELESEPEPEPETTPAAKEKGAQTQSKWFSCFPCCSFCS